MGQPTVTTRTDYRTLADVGVYAQAQSIVDRLSDGGFPVEHLRIVGTGITSVEQVTGRLTKGRAAGLGAAAGAWWGPLIGLLFSFFVIGPWFVMLLTALVLGAVGGALVGFVSHWATGGRRDFSSVRGLEAARYEVQVAAPFHDQAVAASGLR